ncbi:M23 family metallopeptidase [Alicyclobacillus tolerans]|uniref:Murein DD-endopeptidase MepM/ murein hydrolase activator NlpD n=1 Tax=Alicyclobacillus tolerans TaxID=90970 RepID=A0ABT9LZW1_9BACL|nr:M23 family metallopeptidase [Alicyclobacillus tengchongensis]MDP9729799.1 murein DD-endopeptidase MepM/ murein hydrolase activator NlpD [Alicyclobacillus tengchongensis]
MGFLNKPKLQVFLATFCSFTIFVPWGQTTSIAQAATKADIKLQPIYEQYGRRFDVPWGILAGIDRYAELSKTKADRNEHPFYGYAFDDVAWSGLSNPNSHDIDPMTISLFGGLGVDANRDRIASQIEAEDRIAALASWIDLESGESDLDECVWALFQDPVAMDRVFAFSRIFETFGLHPEGHCFPVDKRYNYTVKHTFGAGRSFGGRRIHEGVDIFASYGTPVLACSYGYVELMGWNRFGGWRVGIRDGDNYYYYYAHLSSFAKGVKQGSLVRPGQVIGYVGSTGYGPPGTAGKFPPHLHFGIYREIGHREWAFSPSSMLASWERQKQTVMRVKS